MTKPIPILKCITERGYMTMIDTNEMSRVLTAYKKDFNKFLWKNEQFKWKAVKQFQNNWDIDAPDFTAMLDKAFARTESLLASVHSYPLGMIKEFSKAAPEEMRAAFRNLFDESISVVTRVEDFQKEADKMLVKYRPTGNDWKSHYQNTNSISTYLWLKFPEKYFIYKSSVFKKVSELLFTGNKPQKVSKAGIILQAFGSYNEIVECIKKDRELINLVGEAVHSNPDCYTDSGLHTLAIDVGYYISNYYDPTKVVSADISKDDWKTYLTDVESQHTEAMQMLKAILLLDGEASCKKLAETYGGHSSRYINGAVSIGKRAKKYFDLPAVIAEDGTEKFYVIPFDGAESNEGGNKVFVYKLKSNLRAALEELDLSQIDPYVKNENDQPEEDRNYWWLNANPNVWSFSAISVNEEQSYTLLNQNGNKRRIYKNFIDAKAGDAVICYESTPVKQVVALAKVTKPQDGISIGFTKTESFVNPIDYAVLKDYTELANMEYFVAPQGSLFRLTKAEFDLIMDVVREANPLLEEKEKDTYSKSDFLSEVYMSETDYDSLTSVLKRKRNIILQGAPGVGKTFAAKRLAYSVMGEKDENRIEFIQFHQNYSYEDFMMGYRPADDGFELKYGVFYRFCTIAANNKDKPYFFIIDEINRGNMSKIFGELLMLIENEYRGKRATLAYNGMQFSVPENLYIIGMMNTADRSLAMIDYALRRRFSFVNMTPGFKTDGFKKYCDSIGNKTFTKLVDKVIDLNNAIADDKSLGPGFCIGHSYFCNHTAEEDPAWIKEIVTYDIIPMLSEYWFDENSKVQKWTDELNGVFNE